MLWNAIMILARYMLETEFRSCRRRDDGTSRSTGRLNIETARRPAPHHSGFWVLHQTHIHLARIMIAFHNMLYTFAKTFHEQTLSFAAQDPKQKPVERCSPAAEFVEDRRDGDSCSLWARCPGGHRLCCLPDLQTHERETESGFDNFCFSLSFTCGHARRSVQGCPDAACGSEQSVFRGYSVAIPFRVDLDTDGHPFSDSGPFRCAPRAEDGGPTENCGQTDVQGRSKKPREKAFRR